jgi:hypothetical protein
MASAGLIATVSATRPLKPASLGAILRHCLVGTDVAVETSVAQHVVGVPLRREAQLWVDPQIVRAAGLMLQGVYIGDDAVGWA